MSDLKLFRIGGKSVTKVHGASVALERSLQSLIEENLETFLGVRFLASEYRTSQDHNGRMDTIGIDENGCPVIIEYKRASNINVINQGLFYLDWLVNHRGDFEMLVLKKFGQATADTVEWRAPRLICIAGDFSRYDEYAIKQMNRNIELIRYVKFDNDLLLLEQINAASAPSSEIEPDTIDSPPSQKHKYTTVSEYLAKADSELRNLFDVVQEHLESMGDDVQFKALRFYFAFKRIKNFACLEIKNKEKKLLLYLKVDPENLDDKYFEDDIFRDVREIGHFGTGDLEVTIRSLDDLERAKLFIEQSYDNA